MVCCLYQLINSLTTRIGTLRLIVLANSSLWLVLSNALDESKEAENTEVSLLTYYDTVCLSKKKHTCQCHVVT